MNQKTEFALKALGTLNFRALCREYGISAKTGYKWKERFLQSGLGGMADQSRRPHSHASQLSEQVTCALVALRERHPTWGARKIQELYRRAHPGEPLPSESSIKRVLESCGLVQKRRPRVVRSTSHLNTGRRAQKPNEVWTVDFKGWWYDVDSKRCEPLTVRDECSRFVLETRRLPNACTHSVWECFERLFERYGLPQAIRSDNGAPFASSTAVLGLSQLSSRWVALGIDLERGRPSCPQDNGAHERLHRDLADEVQSRARGSTQEELDMWREEFNHQRPHEALGMKMPAEVYQRSTVRYNGLPDALDYGTMETRIISRCGNLRWQGGQIFLSGSLAGWNVGLQPRHDGDWDVYFSRLLLGQVDPTTLSFKRGASASFEADKPQENL
ncbi:helix-turn-helix domain-containing protein [Verrucomicrobium sp. BvORR106]|uniref:helix-turn-helix domain-containing protein n=1 Tax=Verrucomicrobium sp. BvORR106 TaxID=1403819 RepID=UPI00068FDC50|nr:helix-turn-helix domain-containing protein [Verrucomicrobium sp. BvORR106]